MASDPDGTVVRYEFLNGTVLVSSGLTSSVQIVVTANSVITVRAVDDKGGVTAKAFSLVYEAPSNINYAPTLTLTSQYPTAKTAQVNILAADSDGTVAKLQLYLNGRLVYTVMPNATRFSATLALSRGTVAVTVRVVATDNKGAVTEKSIVVK